MQSRRSFIGALMALPFVGAVARKVKGAVSGKAIPGVTYFRAATPGADLPSGKTITLNGEDIHCCCSEANLVEGWAACYPWGYKPDGTLYLLEPPMECNKLVRVKGEMVYINGVSYTPCRLYGNVRLVNRTAVAPQTPRKPDADAETTELLKNIEGSMRELSQSVANLHCD